MTSYLIGCLPTHFSTVLCYRITVIYLQTHILKYDIMFMHDHATKYCKHPLQIQPNIMRPCYLDK